MKITIRTFLFYLLVFKLSTSFSQTAYKFAFDQVDEIPAPIEKVFSENPRFCIFPSGNYANFNLSSSNPVFDRVLTSGRVTFGSSSLMLAPLKDLLLKQNILNEEGQLYLLKSSEPAVLIHNDLYLISTGLIAQSLNWNNLVYLIIREQIKLKENGLKEISAYKPCKTIDDLIHVYGSFDNQNIERIDSLSMIDYVDNKLPVQDALRTFDILGFFNLPFEDKVLPNEYFNGESMYIPLEYFRVADIKGASMTQNQFGISENNTTYQQRKNKLLQTFPYTPSVKERDEVFSEVRDQCRYQIIEEQILYNNYEEALYSIHLMQGAEDKATINYLDRMKAHAWYGLVRSRFAYDANHYPKRQINTIQSESDRFFRIMKRFDAYAIGALSLRYVTDIANSNSDLRDEALLLRTEIVQELLKSGRFPFDKFAKQPLKIDLSDSIVSKYEKIDAASEKEIIAPEGSEFYFYAISDLMNDTSFTNKLVLDKNTSVRPPLTGLNSSVYTYNKKGFAVKKSEEQLTYLAESIPFVNKKCNTQVEKSLNTKKSYSETAEFNQILLYNYISSKNATSLFPLAYNRLDQSINNYESIELFTQFTYRYRLRMKNYYFLSFLVVPIPYVATDMIISGNRSHFTAFFYNPKTRKIENSEQSDFCYRWNKFNTKAQLINTINSTK